MWRRRGRPDMESNYTYRPRPRPREVYEFQCVCDRWVETETREGECPGCGRGYLLMWNGGASMRPQVKTITEQYERDYAPTGGVHGYSGDGRGQAGDSGVRERGERQDKVYSDHAGKGRRRPPGSEMSKDVKKGHRGVGD